MKNKDCILLIDDSPSTNIYNKKLIEKTGIGSEIFDVYNGIEALDFLNKSGSFAEKECPAPNIIFLDINMPKMDGFEFLEHYSQMCQLKRKNVLVVFLTTSNWSKDKVKAIENGLVYDFLEKPLRIEEFKRVYDYYLHTQSTEKVS